MKIFHCLRSFFPDNSAGTEIYVAALCKALQNDGIEVAVVKPSFDTSTEEYIYNGIRVLPYLETSKATAELQVGVRAPGGLVNFIKLLQLEKPDAVHFHEVAGSNGITIYHVLAANELDLPIFTTFHLSGNICMRNTFLYKNKVACNGIIDEYKCAVCMLQKKGFAMGVPEAISYLGKKFKKHVSSGGIGKLFNYPLYVKQHRSRLQVVNTSSNKMFVLSEWYKDLLVLNGLDKNKIIVLPAAIPADKPLDEIKHHKPCPSGKVRLVYAGRISHIKGLHVLLAAVANLKKQNWELDIYGPVFETRYNESCRKISENNSSINWMGIIPHDNIIPTLSKYDAMVFPSIVQETMGLIMLEAFAAGIPVIGSSIWSVNEKIKDGVNGLIFKTGNSTSLRATLEKVLNDPPMLVRLCENVKAPIYMSEVAKVTSLAYTEVLNFTVENTLDLSKMGKELKDKSKHS